MRFHVNRLYLDVLVAEDSYFCSTTYLTLFIMDTLVSSEDAYDRSFALFAKIKNISSSWQSESKKDAYFWFCWHF